MLSTFESVKHLTTDNTSDRNGQKSVIELTPKRSNREKTAKMRFLDSKEYVSCLDLKCINS